MGQPHDSNFGIKRLPAANNECKTKSCNILDYHWEKLSWKISNLFWNQTTHFVRSLQSKRAHGVRIWML